MLASLECQFAQIKVRVWRGGHNHNIDRSIFHHLIRSSERLDARMILLRIVIRFRSALDYSVELQFWDLLDEGNMEDLGAEAVANDADVINFRGHGNSQMSECDMYQ